MGKYNNYVKTDIPWIGEIPSHWQVMSFKRRMTIKNGADYKDVASDEGYPVIGSGGQFAFSEKYMYDGEVVLLGRKGTIDRPLYFHGAFWAVDTMFYAVPSKETICRYMYYQALTFPYSFYATATALPSMTQADLGNNKVCVPPKDEQIAISTYLDEKCSIIDKIIAKQEKRKKLLQELRQSIITKAVTKGINPDSVLKDSGIEWIGEIPKHWDLKRIKHIASIHGRVGYKGYTTADLVSEGDGAYTIGGKHISRNILDLSEPEYINWDKYYESPEIMVHKGDIITAQRGTLGRTALVKEDIGPATINPSLVLINGIKINNEYLYWWMVSDSVLSEIALLNTSTAVPMISQFQIANIRIPVPPQKEQEQICCFIRKEIKQVDKSIEKTEHQIKLLREYKQSLITEVVTGKRKVC